jgi:hypothetical protein
MSARYRYILVLVLLVSLLITGIAYFAINSGEEPTDLPADNQAQSGSTPLPTTSSTPNSTSESLLLTLETPTSLTVVVKEPSFIIRGKTRADALLTIDNETVEPDINGQFTHRISLDPGHNIVEIIASTSSGEQNDLVLAVIYSIPSTSIPVNPTPIVIKIDEKISVSAKQGTSDLATATPTTGT